jgi:hypothetical protein
VAPLAPARAAADTVAAGSVPASLAWLTIQRRARALGLEPPPGEPALSSDPLVSAAEDALAHL